MKFRWVDCGTLAFGLNSFLSELVGSRFSTVIFAAEAQSNRGPNVKNWRLKSVLGKPFFGGLVSMGLSLNGSPKRRVADHPWLRTFEFQALEPRHLLAADFGDAPFPYPTFLADNGPSHQIVPWGPRLGNLVSAESDGQPSEFADADSGDDGVVFRSLRVGQTQASVIVNVQNAPGKLDAWFDFNGNGSWADDGEQIFSSVDVGLGDNLLVFAIPADAIIGETFARFRISSSGGLNFDGPAIDGEVEDYMVTIHPSPVRRLSGFTDNTFAGNDDGSIGPIDLGFGETINYFGTLSNTLFINNNGNVTFDSALATFTPFDLSTTNRKILAPFFADVDTRNSSPVTYGTDSIEGRPAFGVLWSNVGYYNSKNNKLNSFELVIMDRSDVGPGDFDVEFNYDYVNWETGDASGGSNGLGGNSARAGFASGIGGPFRELLGSAINGGLLDTNLVTGLVHNSYKSEVPGRYVFNVRDGSVVDPDLIVSEVVVSPATPLSGQEVTINWEISNVGNEATGRDWSDRVRVVETGTNRVILDRLVPYDPLLQENGHIDAGDARARSTTFSLPDGFDGVGFFTVTVTVDALNQIYEVFDNNNSLTAEFESELAPYPDLEVSEVSSPQIGVVGNEVTISWRISNSGNADATGTWTETIRLSPDPLLGSDIFVADVWFTGTIPAGTSIIRTETISIPNLPLADYYFVVQTNTFGGPFEIDLTNNAAIASQPIILQAIDLVVSSISPPLVAFSGQQMLVTWTITNQGSGDFTGTFIDRFWLSDDTVIGGDVFVGGRPFTGSIASGETITRTHFLNIPDGLEGLYYLVVRTDATDLVFEPGVGELNNESLHSSPIEIFLRPFPNLVVNQVIAPSNAFSGQQISVEWVVANSGNGPTNVGSWFDAVYLSTNTTLDDQDVFLGRVLNQAFLDAGESYLSSGTFVLPQGIQGNYFLIIKTDYLNQLDEYLNEDDNVRASNIVSVELTPPPDLRVTQIQQPTLAFSGQPTTVTWTVTNSGIGDTRGAFWRDRVYLSSNQILDESDFILSTVTRQGALASGESYTRTVSVVLPVGISGDYFFIVRTDVFDEVFEHVFSANNTSAASNPTNVLLTPPPDLEVTQVSAPATARSGASISVNYRVANNGSSETPNFSWRDELWLSSSSVFDPDQAVLIGSRSHSGQLLAGSHYDAVLSGILPHGLTGPYHLFVRTDALNSVFELDTENNVKRTLNPVQLESRPADLVVPNVSAVSVVEAGGTLLVSWEVRNQGIGDTIATRWRDRVVLSREGSVGNGQDIELGRVERNGLLGVGQSYQVTNRLFEVPFGVEPGDYVLLVITDAENEVYEGTNENNNRSQPRPITVNRPTADLRVSNIVVGASVASGTRLTIIWTVGNFGLAATSAEWWHDDVYLSTDPFLSSDDLRIGSVIRSNRLVAGQEYTASRDLEIPIDLSGNFYVIVVTDSGNRVEEGAGESNNVLASSSTVTVTLSPVPDLAVVSVSAPTEAFSAQSMVISWTVQNVGMAEAFGRNWYDSVYLSLDQVFDRQSDIYLGFRTRRDPLAAGEQYTQQGSFFIPFGLTGQFYVFVVTDSGNVVHERGALANNVDSTLIPTQIVLAPPADLAVGTITIPDTAISGQNVSITYTVHNLGPNWVRGSWTDALFISADQTWSINDPLLGKINMVNANIAPGGSYTQTLTAPMPGVIPGTYHVIVRSDIRNQIREGNLVNNLAASIDQILVDFEELTLGVPTTGTLSAGQFVYYRVEVPAGETLSIFLDSSATDGFNELYVAHNRVPTRSDFDFASIKPFEVDQRAVVPTTTAGTYYVLIVKASQIVSQESHSISAELVNFTVFDSDFGRGGNIGDRTIHVSGAKLDTTLKAELISSSGKIIDASNFYLANSTSLFLTFNLKDQTTGIYSLNLESRIGEQIFIQDAFEIVHSPAVASPEFLIDAPSSLRRNAVYQFSVSWGNSSLNDIPIPLISVSSNNAFFPVGDSTRQAGRFTFMGLTPEFGPPGIVMPGSVGIRYFQGFSDSNPGNYSIAVENIYGNYEEVFDWNSLVDQVRLSNITREDFIELIPLLEAQVGSTQLDFLKMVSRNVSLLDKRAGSSTEFIQKALELEIEMLMSTRFPSISGRILANNQGILSKALFIEIANEHGNIYVTQTLSNGSFIFPNIASGNYTISVKDHRVVNSSTFSIGENEILSDFEIVVDFASKLSGRIVDLSQQPISQSVVAVFDGLEMVGAALTDSEGLFTLYGLEETEDYSLLIRSPGFARQTKILTEIKSDSELNIVLVPESVILGLVTENSQPVEGNFLVRAVHKEQQIWPEYFSIVEQGRFVISELSPGLYDIDILNETGLSVFNLESLEVGESIEIDLGEIDISLGQGRSDPLMPDRSFIPYRPRDPLKFERAIWRALVQELTRFDPPQGRELWRMYFDSTGPVPVQTVGPGGRLAQAFKKEPTSQARIADALKAAIDQIMSLPEWNKEFNCDESAEKVYFINNLNLPDRLLQAVGDGVTQFPEWQYGGKVGVGGLVGGVGLAGEPGARYPESRFINGSIKVSLGANDVATKVRAELTLTIQDAIDFWPDADLLIFGILRPLRVLEENRYTWEVPMIINIDFTEETDGFGIRRDEACECIPPASSADSKCIERPAAYDPNDIVGPFGFGDENWMPATSILNYTIRFENDAELATAPAQVVRITNQLDSDLDFRTFRLGNFAIGSQVFEVPANRAFYADRIDLTETHGLFVDVFAGINVATGEAFWEFTSIDPTTGEQPIDAFSGFLPPNLTSPEGEGFVTYSVRAKANVPTGTVIDAEARIIFDINEPIDTPPIFNTIDAGIPVSQIAFHSSPSDEATFIVRWDGEDDENGSGIHSFNIFVSTDDQPYVPWLMNTRLREAIFVGEFGRRYKFFASVRDNAGNREATPSEAELDVNIGSLVAQFENGSLIVEDRATGGVNNHLTISVVGSDLIIEDASERFGFAPNDATLSENGRRMVIPVDLISTGVVIRTGAGNDTIIVKSFGLDLPEGLVVDGGLGDDIYQFWADSPIGHVTLLDAGGIDTLDFSPTSLNVTLRLDSSGVQQVTPTMALRLESGNAFENATGGSGNDVLIGNALDNILIGNAGDDVLRGLGGNDTLNGGIGNDRLIGGLGDDRYVFGATAPGGETTWIIEDPREGTDTISFASRSENVTLDLGTTSLQHVHSGRWLRLSSDQAIENAIGGSGDDVLMGNRLDNELRGNAGNDTLNGRLGNDRLIGGLGNDRYVFGGAFTSGYAQALGKETKTIIEHENEGYDVISFAAVTQDVTINLGSTQLQQVHLGRALRLSSGVSIEEVIGGSGNDWLIGNSLDNVLRGNGGNDILNGGLGNDRLIGGEGDDRYVFGDAYVPGEINTIVEHENQGNDTISFAASTLNIRLNLGFAGLQQVNSERWLQLSSGLGVENALGGSGNDILLGNALNNRLVGNGGNDILVGFGGDDILLGGAGRDILIGGYGADRLDGGSGQDILISGFTIHDGNAANLRAIRDVWTSTDRYVDRVVNLKNGVGSSPVALRPGTDVRDDNRNPDRLIGDIGRDWFFAGLNDKIVDLFDDELVEQI